MFILLIPLAIAYVAVAIFLCVLSARWTRKRFNSTTLGAAVFLLIFMAFLGNELFVLGEWKYKCASTSGVTVYQRVPVKGFLLKEGTGKGAVREFLQNDSIFGRGSYEFVEGEKSGQLYHYTAGQTGSFDVNSEIVSEPESKYALSGVKIEGYPASPWKVSQSIYEIDSGKVIGESIRYGYKGGAALTFLRKITGADKEGSAAYCGATRNFLHDVIPYSPEEGSAK